MVPSHVIKIIKTLGYENFKTIKLPESKFWDEDTQRAIRILPEPKSLQKDQNDVKVDNENQSNHPKMTDRVNFTAFPLKSVNQPALVP